MAATRARMTPSRRWPMFPRRQNPNERLANPFTGKSYEQMNKLINRFLLESDMDTDARHVIRKSFFLAQDGNAFDTERKDGLELSHRERRALEVEARNKFDQRFVLYAVIASCSLCATVQGMDETVINQAQEFFKYYFNLQAGDQITTLRLGFINSAPYLSAALCGVWLTDPLNHLMGRRGALFVACFISWTACLWQAFTFSKAQMIVARLYLGLGIGLKSTTAPIYAAECAPKNIRGSLVMMWQMWAAFGLMLGYVAGVIFGSISAINPDTSQKPPVSEDPSQTIGWRLIMGSPLIIPLILNFYLYFLPESPRWLLYKALKGQAQKKEKVSKDRSKTDQDKFQKAFDALCRLRTTKLQAARDMVIIYHRLKEEERLVQHRNRFVELFSVGRNRRALLASVLVMFFQQFCGVNLFSYYSSKVFHEGAGWEDVNKALRVSLGFGVLNFIFAIPAVFMIDTLGRRRLLLCTFPFLALFHLLTAFALQFLRDHSQAKKICVTLSIYLFDVAYSLGEGPVPFVYAAESMPLYVRELGMATASCTNWFFNWLLSFTFPRFWIAFGQMWTFLYYSGWCVVGLFLVICFVPETKGLSLEELDLLFAIPIARHARHGWAEAKWLFRAVFMFQNVGEKPELVLEEDVVLRDSRLHSVRRVRFVRPERKLYETVSQDTDADSGDMFL